MMSWLACHQCRLFGTWIDVFFFCTGTYVGAALMYLRLELRRRGLLPARVQR